MIGAESLTDPIIFNFNELLTKSNRVVLTIAIHRCIDIFVQYQRFHADKGRARKNRAVKPFERYRAGSGGNIWKD